jgi:hypothetical protein
MNWHESFPERHSQPLKQMRFNGWFTPGTRERCAPPAQEPTINHAGAGFIENKRYRMNPRGFAGVVNPKAAPVYQTDAVLILIDGMHRR